MSANIFAGFFVVLASYMGCDYILSSVMFTRGLFVMGPFFCGMKINVLDVTQNFPGIIMGIVNGIGALAFFPVPNMIASLVTEVMLFFF